MHANRRTQLQGGVARRLVVLLAIGTALVGAYAAWRVAFRGGEATKSPAPAADFVGSAACLPCHESEHRAWQGSHHDLAMQPASDETVLGDFDDATFRYAGTTSSFFRDGERFMVRTDGQNGALHDYEIRYTFGVDPLQQYLIDLPGGRLQALSIAWDTRPKNAGGGRWFHLYPGENVTHDDELHWTKWSQNWNLQCAECHSTNLRKNYDPAKRAYATTWSEIDVACEACHGPGSKHLAWAKDRRGADRGLTIALDERHGVRWDADSTTGLPRRSAVRATETEIQLCARCHSRRGVIFENGVAGSPLLATHVPALLSAGLYGADGQIDGEDYEYGSFVQSKMARAGVTCSDCHDPHRLELRAPGDAVCASCHQPERYATPKHTFHPAGSKGSSCVECHMPAKTYMRLDERRDHSLRVPRPDESVALGTRNACNDCHADRSTAWAAASVRTWLGRDARGHQRFASTLHAARGGAEDAEARLVALLRERDQPAIARATAAAELANRVSPLSIGALGMALGDADPLVRMGALDALVGVPPERRWDLASPLLSDSLRALRVLAAGALAGVGGGARNDQERAAFDRAVTEYVAAQELNADQPGGLVNLGDFYAERGDLGRADRSYREALELDPGWVPASVNYADFLRLAGRDTDGERVLRDALARMPRAAALHHALGLWLVRAGRRPEALASLRRAFELEPTEPRFADAYRIAGEEAAGGRP